MYRRFNKIFGEVKMFLYLGLLFFLIGVISFSRETYYTEGESDRWGVLSILCFTVWVVDWSIV